MACRVLPTAVALAVLASVLMASVATAQVSLGGARMPGIGVHRSAGPSPSAPAPAPLGPSRGHRHSAPPPPPGSDLFLADPNTYRPRPSRQHPGRSKYRRSHVTVVVPYGYASVPEDFGSLNETETLAVDVTVDVEPLATQLLAALATPARPTTTTATPPAIVAAPKTLYVVPRCYAGDKPPDPARLPAGCNAADVRVLPAR